MATVSRDLGFLTTEQQELVESHLSLVRRIGSRWRSRCRTHVEYSDLLQVGALGLIDAARRYDPRRHDTFEAFAKQRIRGAICDALRELDPLSRRRRKSVRRLEEAIRDLESRHGREPETEELARELSWDLEAVIEAQGDLAALSVGWAQTLELPEEGEYTEAFSSQPQEDPCSALLKTELVEELAGAISELPDRHQQVLSLYYDEGLTMREIGEILEVTESRVSQLHGSAVANLRGKLRSQAMAGAST
ncbi:MAG: FliA/WhiG family RNA polymerase sigma factor [Acidobacteriota bacterium]